MFDGPYLDRNSKKIKGIIDFYHHKFFYYKRVLDLGCGHADISAALHRLGADITAIDARPDHLKIANKKYPGIKTLKADLDQSWPFAGKQFDLILDLDLLCHMRDYEGHLRAVCASTTHLVLETAVCDSADPFKKEVLEENKGIYDLSINGVSCRPSAAAIERILTECGMNWKRVDSDKYNSGTYSYDWTSKNDGSTNINNRRIWYAVKSDSPMQFSRPPQIPPPPPENLSLNVFQAPRHGKQKTRASQTSPIVFTPPIVQPPNNTPSISSAPFPSVPITRNFRPGKKFVIVIPSYNNEQWCVKNINSAINQNYENYRVLFTDDCSKDNTFELVSEVVKAAKREDITTLVRNEKRLGALHNLYDMIHSCEGDEIILTLDGDDWFPDSNVLTKLNEVYANEDVWLTYGQYTNHPMGGIGVAAPYPSHIIESASIRSYTWGASHLRTFYAWLFQKIKKEDLMRDGIFFPMTWDFAIMMPQLEMAGKHSKYLSDILYVYNMENPINDHKVNVRLQQDLDRHIRGMPRYQSVERSPFKTKIGLILIATSKYTQYIQGMVASADKYFLNDKDVAYYLLTDQKDIEIASNRPIIRIPIKHKPFPYASMDRYKHITRNADMFVQEDYLYYVDVDCLFVDKIDDAIISDLVGVRHCGFLGGGAPFETNPQSMAYVEPSKQKFYYGGGFDGGKRDNYLEMAKWCHEALEKDLSNNIIPIWHDESIKNRYFSEHPPTLNLSPSYHYPDNDIERYKSKWRPYDFQPKILLLSKNHSEVRS